MQRLTQIPRVWAAIALVILLVGGGALFLRGRYGEMQAASFTQVVTVERGAIVAAITPTGEVYAPRLAQLSFDVNKIPLIELNVTPGQQVEKGEVLARIDTTALERAITQAEADLTIAQSELEKAETPYTELDRQQAKLAVSQAEVALAEARDNLDALRNPDIEAAKAAVRDAMVELESAQRDLLITQKSSTVSQNVRDREYEHSWYEVNYGEKLKEYEAGEISKEELDRHWNNLLTAKERLDTVRAQAASTLANAENRVTKAEEALRDARESLATLQAGPDPLELTRAQNQVTQAEIALTKAQASLAEIEAGPDPKDIEVAQARVVSAQATLEEARAALEAATLTAPFDGTVISVGAEVGDLVSSNTIVVTLADLSDLRVRAIMDETDISQVEVGQEAEITFDAFPGRRFRGQVLEVPLQGNLVQNIVTYEVPVSLEGTAGVSLKPGMTANLRVVVGRRENVLLLPTLAVQQGEEGDVVMVQDSPQGTAMATRVEVGLSDGMYVEVVRGLNEGDQVVIEYQSSQEGPIRFPSMPGMLTGGSGRTRP